MKDMMDILFQNGMLMDTHSVSLTKDGEDFCHYAQTVTDTLKALQDHFRATKDYASAQAPAMVYFFCRYEGTGQKSYPYESK